MFLADFKILSKYVNKVSSTTTMFFSFDSILNGNTINLNVLLILILDHNEKNAKKQLQRWIVAIVSLLVIRIEVRLP